VEITIHQALFGYDGGHQLLAASVILPTDSKHYLSVATDLSGSAPPIGFDRAFSGLPVPGSDFYALFSTWLAPEMPRPGCVWSHVLLIEFADLALLPDLGELRQLFRRPAKPDNLAWRNPILFSPHTSTATGISASQQPEGVQLLELLYATPTIPVVKEVPTAETSEDLVFAIWSQQWPRLRRSFRFSTGSFADRGRGGTPFDLQLTPMGNLRAWQRANDRRPPGTAATSAAESPKSPDTWLPLALADLSQPDLQGFRSFLYTNGPDVRESRPAFARLATAYEVLQQNSDDDWLQKLRAIAVLFPEPPEALRLKQSVVAPKDTSTALDAVNHAWATASFLFTAPEAAAYAEVPFDHGLAPLIWKERREDVLSLLGTLVRKDESPAALAFAVAIANILQPADLRFISERYSELIPVLLSYRPSLAFDATTWQLRGYIQSQIYEVLNRMPLPREDWAKILGAMFIAGTYTSVRDVVQKAEPLAMQGAFRWLEQEIAREFLPSREWREALAASATHLLASGTQLEPAHLALCAWCMPAQAATRTISADRPDIQQLASQPLSILVPPLRVPTAFLLMALGLKAETNAGLRPVVNSFYLVHDALASGDYSSESWWLLSPQLPYLGIWRDWDRCEKLRKAVHQWLLDRVTTGDPLLAAAKGVEQQILAKRVLAATPDENDHID